ncbi:MAG: HAD family hydrolase [Saprospiraceae bacterium]|nr:HAD family hydrolase [Saprospiraceae bacterium]
MNLIVFDIDETLTMSDYHHKVAYLKTMEEIGVTEINQDWKSYKHHTDSYILKVNYENNLPKKFDFQILSHFEHRMAEIMLTLEPVKEIRGAIKFVDYLKKEKNYALTFATGSLLKPAILKLEQATIWHDIKLISSSNNFFEREEIVKVAIERAKQYYNVVDFENVISIGDGIWDLKTAQNLNVKFIGVGKKNYNDFKKENIKIHTEDWDNFDFENAEKILLNNTST